MDLLPTIYTHRLMYRNNNNNHHHKNIIEDSNQNDEENGLLKKYHSIEYDELPQHLHHQLHHHQHHHHLHHEHQYPHQIIHSQPKLFRQLSAIPNPIYHYLHLFYINRVETRRNTIANTLHEIVQIAQEILHEVELQEPRFVSTLKVIHTNNIEKKQDDNDDDENNNTSPDTTSNVINSLNTTNTTTSTTSSSSTTTTTTVTTNPMNSSNSNNNSQNGVYYDGLRVLSSNHFEITLYLNQMGVFNFMDDGSIPGGAVLKLSDGRKRSMSLWVEFITASGYLSARKIRARFHSLIGQAIQKSAYRHIVRMLGHTTEVKLCIHDKYILQITPAFRCNGLWPRSASHWPITSHNPIHNELNIELTNTTTTSSNRIKWPSNQLINEVKYEGFCLLSQESVYTKDKQASAEGDAWLLDFYHAEERLLLNHTIRRQCFSILKTLADRHLTGVNNKEINFKHPKSTSSTASTASTSSSTMNMMNSVIQEYDIKTLVLHECEKHPNDDDWTQYTLGDRINSILLQLISCLQHRRCPHYFLPNLDIFRGYSTLGMDITAKQAWRLLRELLTCPQALEYL